MGHIYISITLFILTYWMDVAKLLPWDYYSAEEDEMQPENSFTVQLTGGITEGITGGISSVDTLENGMETSPSNIN